jgi:V8-like Glu-specific endopeptidase
MSGWRSSSNNLKQTKRIGIKSMRERITIQRELELLNQIVPERSQQTPREWEFKPGGQTVSNSFDVPYRCVCRLQVQEKGASGWRDKEPATGVLVGPRHVLTAAHLLDPYYQQRAGQWQVRVYPGFDGSRHLGEEISTRIKVSKGWEAGTKEAGDLGAYDFGMVFLPGDISTKKPKELGGKSLGYWGNPTNGYKTVFAPLDAATLESKTVYSAGYPRGRKKAMWVGTGTLSNVLIRIKDKIERYKRGMDHNAMETLGEEARGMSGGPVWLKRGSTRYLIGVNSSITPVEHVDEKSGTRRKFWRGHAARVTIELFEEVIEWMHAEP